jgi:hypothetical protein
MSAQLRTFKDWLDFTTDICSSAGYGIATLAEKTGNTPSHIRFLRLPLYGQEYVLVLLSDVLIRVPSHYLRQELCAPLIRSPTMHQDIDGLVLMTTNANNM